MENNKFEILEHTADLKIRVYGKNLPELFCHMALAIAEQQSPGLSSSSAKEEWEPVAIQSSDQKSLLVDWLNEILSRSDINHKIYFKFNIQELSETYLKAQIAGQSVDQKQIDIKAATYHNLEIQKTNQHYQATIIFDI